jgi:membrane-associated protease RseP (regulator of RpoE activity)
MQKMDNPIYEEAGSEPDIIRAEVVEIMPGAPWEWQEVRPVRPRRNWRLPLLLFVATCLSTLYVGSQAGLSRGLQYAVPVMVILLCHEMGHFIQAHRYGVYASWPYFIPMPFSPLGTFGAVIAMEPRIGGRRALFDIGISGPLAGLVPTFIFLIIGLRHSKYIEVPPNVLAASGGFFYGAPLVFQFLADRLVPSSSGTVLRLDPMAFAGWVGLLITSLNLIPIGQLDGGHVLYALLRRKAHRVARFLLFAALLLVILYWHEWIVMIALLFLLGPIHPPTADDEEPLGTVRIILGWLTLAFIIVGFTPEPIIVPS